MNIDTILLLILLFIGLILAFFGIKVWETLMGIIGGFIGFFIGFGAGLYFSGNWLVAFILGIVGGFLGSMLFHYLVEAALALVVAALIAGFIYYMGGADPGSFYLYGAIAAFVIVFALAFYFMDELIGVFTALVGAVLSGAALWLLTGGSTVALILAAVIFVSGAALQTLVLTD